MTSLTYAWRWQMGDGGMPRSRLNVLFGLWGLLAFLTLPLWNDFKPDYTLRYFWPDIGRFSLHGFIAAQTRNASNLAVLALAMAACWRTGDCGLRWVLSLIHI